jgi:superfamily II DNA or RNA helicase
LALGQIFQSVAFDYEILDAIREGYLVPIEQRVITLESLDFSQMATTAGDLNGADLAAEMEKEKILYGVADATMKEVGERRTVIFTVSVKQAEALCGILNGYRRDCAAWICGKTAKDRRAAALKKFSNGEIQIMVNCGVLLEGYNEVGIQHVVMARPTKSRCLYSQAIGRGTRPLAGVIDGIETDEGRRAAIAASDKPALVVVDFAGNAGRHKLMTSADILGGNYSDEEVARTTEMLKKSAIPRNTAELLDEAKAEIAAENERRRLEAEAREKRDAERRGRIRATATYTVQIVNAFDSLDIVPTRSRGWDSGKVISEKMANLLRKHLGLDPSRVTYHEARQLLGELFRRWDNKLCTPKQGGILKRHGIDTKNLSMSDASALIDQLAKNNWKKPEGFGQPAQEKVFA